MRHGCLLHSNAWRAPYVKEEDISLSADSGAVSPEFHWIMRSSKEIFLVLTAQLGACRTLTT